MTPRDAVAAMHLRVPARGNRKLRRLLEHVDADQQVKAWWHAANVNAVLRLAINDHSWVHVQIITNIALKLCRLLVKHGVSCRCGTTDSSPMTPRSSSSSPRSSTTSACRFTGVITRTGASSSQSRRCESLAGIYDEPELTIVVSEALQAITSHRADGEPLSLEAGILRVADALDMAKGRSDPVRAWLVLDPLALRSGDRRGENHRRPDSAGDGRDRDEQLVRDLPGRRSAEGEAHGSGLEPYVEVMPVSTRMPRNGSRPSTGSIWRRHQGRMAESAGRCGVV